ncbi:tetratricopeptide repeat protein [Rhodobaculum claviforme]|uniref:Cell division coordinator CpoB n=1 Tax=Rhodobaculum claviforme TaxID=1549854 RepID=A0A934TMH0_9RHOB|nr:tetratricopeptide repeat protein [Rhodobaculum claviforme]MBK5928181.1 hypothetical protein [Rhodobaculum claviforme]
MGGRAPRRVRAAGLAVVLGLGVILGPGAGGAEAQTQAQTLADIRAELEAVRDALAGLQAELAPGAGVAASEAVAGSVLDRVDALERSVQRLTAATDELGFRIDAVVADGTNRIGDIEFRLSELEGGDPASAPPTVPLGGEGAAPGAAAPVPGPDTPALLAGERAAFDAAAAAHAAGDWSGAVALLDAFAEAYPLGVLTPRAHLLRADALEQMGDAAAAARAWLAGYGADPDGATAPGALLGLGSALARLDQAEEACIMLDEVLLRFPDSAEASDADDARTEIGCP